MRIAVLVIGLAVSLIVLLQSCAANVAGPLVSQSLKQAGGAGMLVALLFIIGAGFAMRLPIVSIVVFAFGAIIAISTGLNSEFRDLQVWGWLSAILAVLSYFGHRERKRSLKPEVASNVPPIIKNQPAAATETMISSEMAHEKKPSPEMAAFMKPWSLAATGFVLGFIALIIVLFSQINLPTQSGSTAATTVTPAAAPMDQSFSGIRLSGSDLPKVVSTYRENEMRFKRDFLGKQFSDVLPFKSATESIFVKGSYLVGFGNNIISDVNCTVKSPTEISAIANWNKGDQIHIEGNVKDVTLGSVNLESCRLSR